MSVNSSWGELECWQAYGSLGDHACDYRQLSYSDARSSERFQTYMRAAHGMIYSPDDRVLWNTYPTKAAVMLQMRFDGVIGFPGGLVDPGEDPVSALNRECKEEIRLNMDKFKFEEKDHLCSFVNEKKQLLLYFYVQRVSMSDFAAIECASFSAEEYGVEAMGVIRPPLYTMADGLRGFPAFLTNQFAGNAKQQLVMGLEMLEIMSHEEIQQAVKASKTIGKL